MRKGSFAKWAVVLVAGAATLAVCTATPASSFLYVSLTQMARIAPLIVRARCTSNAVRWDDGEIWTFTSFAVEEVWRGPATKEITVRLLGGTAGQLTSHVSGVPRFRAGEDVVLFVEPISHGDLSVVGWKEGTFRIHADGRNMAEIVTQDSASFTMFDPARKRFIASGISNVTLGTLHAEVDEALRSVEEVRR